MGQYLPRDMRSMILVLDEADRLALMRQRKITLPLVREATQNLSIELLKPEEE